MHPFGGLQTSSFKSFYRKREEFNPIKVRLVSTQAKLVVVNEPSTLLRRCCDKDWDMIAQKHPAQGNNSNLDFCISLTLRPKDQLLPIEKGLGYRIIKRESDKDLVIEDRSTWPTVEYVVTDLFGGDLWSHELMPQSSSPGT